VLHFEDMKFSLLLRILKHDFLHVSVWSELHMVLANRTVLSQIQLIVSFNHRASWRW